MAERPPPPWLIYAEALGLLAVYLLSFGVLYRMVAKRAPDAWSAAVAGQAVTLAAVAAFVVLLNRAAIHRRGLPAPPRSGLPPLRVASTALFLLGSIALLVRILAPEFDDVEFARYGLGHEATFRRFLWTLPFGVATEEIVFRACQDRLRSTLGARASVGAIAVAFALYHLAPGQPIGRQEGIALAATAAGGLVLAWLYHRSGSMGLVLAVHLGYDVFAVSQGRLHVDRRSAAEAAMWTAWLVGSAVLAKGLWQSAAAGKISVRHLPELSPVPLGWRIAGLVAFGLGVPFALRELRGLF